jgi:hypothetical protein
MDPTTHMQALGYASADAGAVATCAACFTAVGASPYMAPLLGAVAVFAFRTAAHFAERYYTARFPLARKRSPKPEP